MIELDSISKIYGKGPTALTALKQVSLTVEDNSSIAIIGKSGSGKSTLMHIMSGLDRPSSGNVIVDGQDLFGLRKRDMDTFRNQTMSFIFQSFFVEANQTCYENVLLPLEIAGTPLGARRQLVMEALEAVELAEKYTTPAGNLSGGQKQRLAIARAIVNKPRILFADEPTGNLDSATSETIMDLLFSINTQNEGILIIVTHDEDVAARCDRRIKIHDGSIVIHKVKSS